MTAARRLLLCHNSLVVVILLRAEWSAGQGAAQAGRERTLTANWHGPINGLPMNNLPAGPLTGQGDLGLTIQTGNSSGAVEYWLGLNQFSGAPNSSEAFGGRGLHELPANYTNGPDKTLDPRVPYPRIVSLGGMTVASAHFVGSNVSFEAVQHFSNGTLTTRYTREDGEMLL